MFEYFLIRLIDSNEKALQSLGFLPVYSEDFFNFVEELLKEYPNKHPSFYAVYLHEYISESIDGSEIISYYLFSNYFIRFWFMFSYDILLITTLDK